MKTKICSRCGDEYDEEAFFRRNPDKRLANAFARKDTRPVCIGCELSKRTEIKESDRWLSKARDTLRRHAKKYGIETIEFGRKYGWETPRIAHHLRHDYENTCEYCRKPYAAMTHGLSDITLDILNPLEPPYYETNVKRCCRTCNQEKSRTPPELWARKLICWRQWEENQKNGIGPIDLGKMFHSYFISS